MSVEIGVPGWLSLGALQLSKAIKDPMRRTKQSAIAAGLMILVPRLPGHGSIGTCA
jgi:hypothetical protein